MARPYWSGQLQISLVSFGIKLFTATDPASEISFHQIDRKTGERVHHRKVVDGEEPVEASEIVKGYEYQPGKYITIEPQEIERLRIDSKRTLDIAQFVSLDELPLALFEKPYFVLPEGDGTAFAVVRKALSKSKKAGLGEITFAGREHLVAIAAAPGEQSQGMIAYTLRYSGELRDQSEYFSEIKPQTIDSEQLALANQLIERYSQPLQIDSFKDDYETALRKLVDAKVNKEPLPLEDKPRKSGKVINLMDALKQSLQSPPAKPQASSPQPKASAKAKTKSTKGGPRLVPARKKLKSA